MANPKPSKQNSTKSPQATEAATLKDELKEHHGRIDINKLLRIKPSKELSPGISLMKEPVKNPVSQKAVIPRQQRYYCSKICHPYVFHYH